MSLPKDRRRAAKAVGDGRCVSPAGRRLAVSNVAGPCLQDARAEALGALLAAAGDVVVAVATRRRRGAVAAAGVQLADDLREAGVVVAVEVVVGAHVAGLLGALLLLVVGLEHGGLDDLAAGGVDGVGDVGVQLDAAIDVAGGAVLVELVAALVAEAGAQVVLAAARA